MKAALIWGVVALVLLVPAYLAVTSPLLAWRDPVYIAAGLAGIVAMSLLLVQPLLAAGALPGLPTIRGRRIHRWTGATLLTAVILHVAGLWLTSPPDVIDTLLFRSPTPFSVWGVIAMIALFATVLLAALRRPLRLRWRLWRVGHLSLAVIIVGGSILHALLIEGTMEPVSKATLCAFVALATLNAWRRG